MDFGVGIKSLLTNPANFFITGGDAFVQDKSQLTNDGLGDIFAANVFGHYIMVTVFMTTTAVEYSIPLCLNSYVLMYLTFIYFYLFFFRYMN